MMSTLKRYEWQQNLTQDECFLREKLSEERERCALLKNAK